jgi:hypothetical protein
VHKFLGRLRFLFWSLICVVPQCRTCSMSDVWCPEVWNGFYIFEKFVHPCIYFKTTGLIMLSYSLLLLRNATFPRLWQTSKYLKCRLAMKALLIVFQYRLQFKWGQVHFDSQQFWRKWVCFIFRTSHYQACFGADRLPQQIVIKMIFSVFGQ